MPGFMYSDGTLQNSHSGVFGQYRFNRQDRDVRGLSLLPATPGHNCTIVAPLDECVCLHPHKVARLGEKENHNQTPKIQQPFLLQPHEQLYCVVARETLKQCFKKIIYIKKCISYLQGSVLARAAALQTMLSTTLLGQERPCTLPGTWALRAKGRGCYYFSSTLYCKGGCSTSHCPQ